jgi:adenosylhomocysteine nucleosidase
LKSILLVAAERRELAGILRHCRGRRRLDWPVDFAWSAELNGQRLVMVANGPGPALAGEAVRRAFAQARAEAVVSTGWCGALDPSFELGDILVSSRVEALDQQVRYNALIPRTERAYRSGCLISLDRVVHRVEEKAALRAAGGAAVDMEAAAVACEARRLGAPFFCVRVVMDRAGEGFALDLNWVRGPDGRFSRARVLGAVLVRPRLLMPELMRLERQCRLTARALGDFLADCRFEF